MLSKYTCLYCKKEYDCKVKSKFCCKECRDLYLIEEKFKDKKEGVDYVVCKWCGVKTPRIYGRHIKYSHPGKTTDDYKIEFPNSPLYSLIFY